jgi:hypothetical protein
VQVSFRLRGLPFLAPSGCLKGLYTSIFEPLGHPAIDGMLVLRIGVLVAYKVAGRIGDASEMPVSSHAIFVV